MNILEVQDLCKTYGTGETEVHALNHVSFSVRKGEFIAIIGESGSGKSTLLNVIGALDSVTSGRVWIDAWIERTPETPSQPAFRRPAAACGDWPGIGYTPCPDYGR